MTSNRSASAILIALLISAPAWSQQTNIPDTPAGAVLSAWLDAFNSGDKARLEQFEAQYDGRDPGNVENQARFRANTGGFDVGAIRKSTPTYIEYMAVERATRREVVGMLEESVRLRREQAARA